MSCPGHLASASVINETLELLGPLFVRDIAPLEGSPLLEGIALSWIDRESIRAFIEAPASREEAIRIQERLQKRCRWERIVDTGEIELVAGADAAYGKERVYAAAALFSLETKELVRRSTAVMPLTFPYIPGLLAFREGPALLSSLLALPVRPHAIFFNGHGRAHPRRFGLASHMGVILGVPSVGVAERILLGKAELPEERAGAVSPLIEGGEVIGALVRTRARARPVVVSEGHMVDLAQAVELVLLATQGRRIPEPLRQADRIANALRREDEGR